MKTILKLQGILLLLSINTICLAQFNFSNSPVWQVSKNYPTGLGWADFDHNGYSDIVISVGLDIVNGPTLIYFNSDGALSETPGWTSTFLAPGCGLYLNDFDHNGNVDIAVASLGLISNGMQPVPNFIYMNNSGFPLTPGWLSQPGNAFSCTGGDIDVDGDIDLAFSRGDFATSNSQKALLFINSSGVFDSIPNWQSDSLYYGTDVAFADIDLDGDLDLALGARTKGVLVFYSENGILETSPSWSSHQVAGARQMAFGDVDNDGYPDLAIASPGEKFYLFKNINGTLDTIPHWVSVPGNEPSSVAWADVDGDGDLDLAAGSWNTNLGIFENLNGSLADTFSWSKSVGGGLQQIAWMDYDQDNLIDTVKVFQGDGHKKLFYIGKQPIHKVSSMEKNGIIVPQSQYCYDPVDGWISVSTAPQPGDILVLNYTYSKDLDLSLTNWSSVRLYRNLNPLTSLPELKYNQGKPVLYQNEPNPCYGMTIIRFFLPGEDFISLSLYNAQGKKSADLLNKTFPKGNHEFCFSTVQLQPGIYLCTLQGKNFHLTRKIIIR